MVGALRPACAITQVALAREALGEAHETTLTLEAKAARLAQSLVGRSEGTRQLNVRATVNDAELWSVPRPFLYTLMVRVLSASGAVLDTVNVTTGIRSVHFDADKGLLLNQEPVKVRGYCDHSNFGGVGGAVPDRVNLFRAQTLRATGGNAWRMARPTFLLLVLLVLVLVLVL